MKINLYHTILSGNLGDGWNDNTKAAHALAQYTKKIWARDLGNYKKAHEINIDIDVETATGTGPETVVDIDDSEMSDDAFDLKAEVEFTITDKNKIWEYFCDSEEAKRLF